MIKYLEINLSGKGGKGDKIQLFGSHIKYVPYVRFCTARQQPGRVRGAAGPRPCRGVAAHPQAYAGRWPRPGEAERCSRGGPHGGAGSQVSPLLPFPSAQSPVPRPPKRAPHHGERFFSLRVRSKFIGLSQLSGSPGFVVPVSRPPRQNREPEEPPNDNPHNAPRALAPAPTAALPHLARQPQPAAEDPLQDTGCGCHPGHPTACSPAPAVLFGLITRVLQVSQPLVMRSRWGGGGAQAAAAESVSSRHA